MHGVEVISSRPRNHAGDILAGWFAQRLLDERFFNLSGGGKEPAASPVCVGSLTNLLRDRDQLRHPSRTWAAGIKPSPLIPVVQWPLPGATSRRDRNPVRKQQLNSHLSRWSPSSEHFWVAARQALGCREPSRYDPDKPLRPTQFTFPSFTRTGPPLA